MRKFTNFSFVLLLLLFCFSCKEKAKPNSDSENNATKVGNEVLDSNTTKASKQKELVKETAKSSSDFDVNDTIKVSGEFWGFNATKAGCQKELVEVPVSRSDWIFKTDKGLCIYVHGKTPIGLSSFTPKGEKVEIKAIVKKTVKGQFYLEKIE
jgi:hypothetical protein